MKICKQCGNAIAFDSRATKYCSNECRKRVKYEKDRAWVKANLEKVAAYARKWYKENIETRRQEKRDAYRQKCLKKLESEGIK